MKEVEKLWGKEQWIVNTEDYCGKILYLKENHQCSLHMHPIKDETFYVLKGVVQLEVDSQTYMMQEGDFIRILPNTYHRFTGFTDSVIVEFSTHHEDDDVVRKEESRKLPDYDYHILSD